MAFVGHITLDGKQYMLRQMPQRTFANQMAPAIGQGQSKYQDLTSWSAWIQNDWQDGNGRLDPGESGGFLYGEADSRVPKQLILPAKLEITGTLSDAESPSKYVPDNVDGYIRVGAGGVEKLAFRYTTSANPQTLIQYLLVHFPKNMTVNVDVYTDSASLPDTLVSTATQVIQESLPGYHWYPFNNTISVAPPVDRWLAISPANAADYFDVARTSDLSVLDPIYVAQLTTGTWSTTGVVGYDFPWIEFLTAGYIPISGGGGVGFFRFNGQLYAYSTNTVYQWDVLNEEWDSVATLTDFAAANYTDITAAVVFDGYVYFSSSGATGHARMATNHAITTSSKNVTLFAEYNGYLWAANGNELEYSRDATTWEPTASFPAEGPIIVGPPDFSITGIGGIGRTAFAATPYGLYRITEGDFAVPATRWGGIDYSNGSVITSFRDALYVLVNGRIIRYTEDGNAQDVWLTRDDDMLQATIGTPIGMDVMNNWLVVVANIPTGGFTPSFTTGDAVGYPTIWALQGSSWHQLAILPAAMGSFAVTSLPPHDMAIYYDRLSRRLWSMGGWAGATMVFNQYIPDYTLNPYNDKEYLYAPNAWIEWDWFDGNIFEVYKDYESVTIIGENFSASQYVEVYWKDDASTDWEFLDTATGNVTEMRWDIDRGDRPATRRLKLGMRLVTTDANETPRIRAIRVKYHPMVRDWYQWNLAIDIAGHSGQYQEGVGTGEVNTRTGEEMDLELETIAKAPGIFLYTDIDGRQYEVKVKGGSFQYTRYEHNANTDAVEWEGVWNIQIEQVTQDAYVAP